MGLDSEVFAGEWRGERSKATFFRDFAADPADAGILYHLSTASPMAEYLEHCPNPLFVNYHNITPHDLLAPWEPGVAPELNVARSQLNQLAGKTRRSVGVSKYNADELASVGYDEPLVAPILFDFNDFTAKHDAKVDSRLKKQKQDGGADWLFVGRITPHKCQHEIVEALAVYRRLYDANARLTLVGGISSHRYWTALRDLVSSLDLNDAVTITQGVSNEALGSYYANADLFICLSEHEGFGVPVLEAMQADVPVVAFNSSAVGETLGNAGVLLQKKSPGLVAVAAQRVIADQDLSRYLRSLGTERLADFSLDATERKWKEVIDQLVSSS
jgi:L-malate glycosyltransferase